jgi:hypothetical protein
MNPGERPPGYGVNQGVKDSYLSSRPSGNLPPGSPYASDPSANPYAAPQAAIVPTTGVRGHAPAVKWIYAVLFAGYAACEAYAEITGANDNKDPFGLNSSSMFGSSGTPNASGAAALMGSAFLGIAMLIVGLVWLGMSWSSVPPGYRTTRAGRTMSPGSAVGFMFIPCFNLYWIFVANLGLCDAVDYLLGHYNASRRSPRALATAACVVHLVSGVASLASPWFGLVSPILWFLYMFQMDESKKEMLAFLQRDGLAAA